MIMTKLFCYFGEKAPNVLEIYLVLATIGEAGGDFLGFFLSDF